jgi:hypothetical protein
MRSSEHKRPSATNLQKLLLKIERMYATIGSATEANLSKFPPTLAVVQQWLTVRQDFNQGLDRAQLENKAFQVIRSIADLKDHLRAAARGLQRDSDEVEQIINASLPLQLMTDLANYDKQGGHVMTQPNLLNSNG